MTKRCNRQFVICFHATLILTLFAGVHEAHAQNLGFLNNSPISYMKERDLQQLNKAAGIALNTKADGETLQWDNNGTGNSVAIHGTITTSNTVKDGATTCRSVAIVAQAKGQTQSWTPVACKATNGTWKLQKR